MPFTRPRRLKNQIPRARPMAPKATPPTAIPIAASTLKALDPRVVAVAVAGLAEAVIVDVAIDLPVASE